MVDAQNESGARAAGGRSVINIIVAVAPLLVCASTIIASKKNKILI
jgi:hypothetical protein